MTAPGGRRVAVLALGGLLSLAGCAPWSRAVLGPSTVAPVSLFVDGGASQIDYRRGTGIQTLTPTLARSDFGIDATWAVVDYRRSRDEAAGTELVTDLHQVRSLDAALEHLMAEEDLFLAAHEQDARAMLGRPAPPLDVSADGVMHPTDVQRRHAATSASLEGDVIRVVVESALVVTAWRAPCGGTEMPETEVVVDGVRWTRTYRLDASGAVQGVETSEPSRWPAVECDPRLASSDPA